MIKIRIPNNNIEERKYILDIILDEFLGLNYSLEIGSFDYEIILQNKKKLTIKDKFFNKYPNNLEYLKKKNIPKKIENLDIFAACFFMLTRWEEYVDKNRDKHDRFLVFDSLAFKNNFLHRPIVDEYIEILRNMFLNSDKNIKFKLYSSKLFLTHDVDELYKWKSWKHVIRVVIGDILKRKDINLACNRIKEYYLIKTKNKKDPFDTFDLLMDISESIGIKSRFYFMSGGNTRYDNRYRIDELKSLELIQKIKNREHIIGFHPSYNAYNDHELFQKEKRILETTIGQKVTEGREHYLRFEVPTTWQIWEDNNMLIDSTCGYANKEGFRCGTGNEFSVFNILTRKKLKLKERPLLVMDCSLFEYNNYSFDEAILKIRNIKDSSNFMTLLWHNSFIKKFEFYINFCR